MTAATFYTNCLFCNILVSVWPAILKGYLLTNDAVCNQAFCKMDNAEEVNIWCHIAVCNINAYACSVKLIVQCIKWIHVWENYIVHKPGSCKRVPTVYRSSQLRLFVPCIFMYECMYVCMYVCMHAGKHAYVNIHA